jgi:hypothetical protein
MQGKSSFWATLLLSSMIIVGCAGREPHIIQAHSSFDDKLACDDVNLQISQTNSKMLELAREANSTSGKNMIMGVAGMLVFWPALFAMDLKDAAGQELLGYEARNATLLHVGKKKGCATEPAYSAADATQMISEEGSFDQAADVSENDEDQGTPGPAGTAKHRTANAGASKAPSHSHNLVAAPLAPSTRSKGNGETVTLKNLMKRFLRGEISRAEYLELRGNMAPG